MKKLQDKLTKREQENTLRKLSLQEGLVDFFSNDYLGLARNSELTKNIEEECLKHSGMVNGSTGSRLLSGNSEYAVDLEKYLAQVFQAEKALVFNSGYNANISVLSSIPQKGDTIICDELIHASLIDGARLSFAQRYSFRHNDLNDLEQKIKKSSGDVYVVVETVYSMDGDFAPLEELVKLCEQYNAHLIVDEAHSTGIWGKGGAGIACEKKLQDRIFARIYTFGKAPGVHGGCVAGTGILINYLINFARPFIYTTALPVHGLASIRKSFEYNAAHPELSKYLMNKISLYRKTIKESGIKSENIVESKSPIQVVLVPGVDKVKSLAEKVRTAGFDVRPILSPTVREGEERIRICLHVYNSDEEIVSLIKTIAKEL